MEKKYCTVVILAVGRDSRVDGKAAKQYVKIGGKPPVAYALEVLEASPVIDGIIFMTDIGHTEYIRTRIVETCGPKKVNTIGTGNDERYESIWKALYTLMEWEEEERESMVRGRQDEYMFIHDGARPFVTSEIIERVYRTVCSYSACVMGMPVKDTIKLVNQEGMTESSPGRNMVWQTWIPQVFSVPLVVKALVRQMKVDYTGITNGTMVVGAQIGVKAQVVAGSYASIRTTTPRDLFMTEVLRNPVVWLQMSGLGNTG